MAQKPQSFPGYICEILETHADALKKEPCMFRGFVAELGNSKIKEKRIWDQPICGHKLVRCFDSGIWIEERYKCRVRIWECAECGMPIQAGLGLDRTGFGSLWTGSKDFYFNETLKRKYGKDPKTIKSKFDTLKKQIERDNLVASENKRKLELLEIEMKKYCGGING